MWNWVALVVAVVDYLFVVVLALGAAALVGAVGADLVGVPVAALVGAGAAVLALAGKNLVIMWSSAPADGRARRVVARGETVVRGTSSAHCTQR